LFRIFAGQIKKSVPYRLFASKLLPTDGWEHPEQPVTDSPLVGKLTYRKALVKRICHDVRVQTQLFLAGFARLWIVTDCLLVEMRGIEPLASALRTPRSPS
jgi:hypothetical protein